MCSRDDSLSILKKSHQFSGLSDLEVRLTRSNLAFVFPGQGSQKIGMLADYAQQYPQVAATFAEASDVLGYDLWDLCQNGTQEDINLTERTQPLMLTSSVALWRVWQAQGGAEPAWMAGHSLGEWSALVCAGVVDFQAAVGLVRHRGAYMQEAVPVGEGAMAAIIGLDDAAIMSACDASANDEVVAAVNFNAPGQVVIAGTLAAVERAIAACKEAGAKRALPLPVSAPFHTTLMKPAADRLAEQVRGTRFHAPNIPVVHNVHAQAEGDPAVIQELMIEQIYKPVLWVDCVTELHRRGVSLAVECGPGKVLTGLTKRIVKDMNAQSIEEAAGLETALELVSG